MVCLPALVGPVSKSIGHESRGAGWGGGRGDGMEVGTRGNGQEFVLSKCRAGGTGWYRDRPEGPGDEFVFSI